MKTSNKILAGAFIIIVMAMIIGNVAVKREIKKVADENGIMIEQNDTLENNSSSVNIQLKID
ncbi:MAG: hypothetical protein LLF95_02355 [Bacteroidales bacterium]|nr:hypothetical protein [Bacteroidales bacterium]